MLRQLRKVIDDYRFDTEWVRNTATVCVVLFVVPSLLFLQLMFMQGKSRSEWFRRTQNVEVPWYEAAFLEPCVKCEECEHARQ